MTPALSAVYDELLERASRPPLGERAARHRRAFEQRTGLFAQDHPRRASRDAAGWEDALVAGGLAELIGRGLDDPAEQALCRVIGRAQPGVFQLRASGKHPLLRDHWGGGEFLVLARDEVGRSAGDADETVLLGRIVAGLDGCAVLPGLVWLPAEAAPLLPGLLAEARERGMTAALFIEALLRMDHALSTLSRVKARYAFRVEALGRRDP